MALFTPSVVKGTQSALSREDDVVELFKITHIVSIGAFLIGTASVTPGLARGGECGKTRISGVVSALASSDRPSDADTLAGYSPLGIAKINEEQFSVYAFQNGARLNDASGEGQGFADVFDGAGHLIRRFVFKENLNSPPQITEYVSMPTR
jgi:hypothetical protein